MLLDEWITPLKNIMQNIGIMKQPLVDSYWSKYIGGLSMTLNI
jgi:hypothetical protein